MTNAISYPKYNALQKELLECHQALGIRQDICVALSKRLKLVANVHLYTLSWLLQKMPITNSSAELVHVWKKDCKLFQHESAFVQLGLLELFRALFRDCKNGWVICKPNSAELLYEQIKEIELEWVANEKLKKAVGDGTN